jgi:hypothetical protein
MDTSEGKLSKALQLLMELIGEIFRSLAELTELKMSRPGQAISQYDERKSSSKQKQGCKSALS